MCPHRSSPDRHATFSSTRTTTRFSNTTARTPMRSPSRSSATQLHRPERYRRNPCRRQRRSRGDGRAPKKDNAMATVPMDDRGLIVVCPNCGQKNRLAYERLGDEVRCGKCKQTLKAPGEPIEIHQTADFDRLVSR